MFHSIGENTLVRLEGKMEVEKKMVKMRRVENGVSLMQRQFKVGCGWCFGGGVGGVLRVVWVVFWSFHVVVV